jgi:hypothetical protein
MPRTRIAHIAGISVTLLLAGTTVLEAQGEKPRPRLGVPARGAPGQPAAEQQPVAGVAPTSAVSGANTAVAINPEVIALHTTSDLIIKDLGFTGKGEITFELKNRGDVPINPASVNLTDAPAGREAVSPVPEDKQIKVAVYLNNTPYSTVLQPGLAGKQSKTFTIGVPNNTRPGCGQSKPLRTVIDPANVIVEYTDTNNVDTVTAARPCGDLAVASIKKNFNKLKTHYAARITLINKGNAPIETFEYWAKEDFGGHLADLGGQADESTGPLAPGETFKFNIGFVPAYDNMRITVMLDRRLLLEELDESNNYVEKKLN